MKATLAAPGKVRFRIPRWVREDPQSGAANAPVSRSHEGTKGDRREAGLRVFASSCEAVGRIVGGDWIEVDAHAGESAWLLRFDLSPRLVDWTADAAEDLPPSPQGGHDEIPDYTVHFMEWYTPEMAGLCRREPAMRALHGPLVLAKGRLAGTSREETLFAPTLRGEGWRAVALHPAPQTAANAGVARPWTLELERDGETRRIPVADFASVSNLDDPDNWFSLWF